MSKALLVLLLAATTLAAGSFHPDSFEMRIVARLPFSALGEIPDGDADHDDKRELYVFRFRGVFALEHQGGYLFDSTQIAAPEEAFCFDVHDIDRDGKSDFLVQTTHCTLAVYESPDSTALPDNRVWYTWYPDHGGTSTRALVMDLDADSAFEIVASDHVDWRVKVYEHTGDDSYELVAQIPPHGDRDRVKNMQVQTYDLDRDGRPELACGSTSGELTIYETVGDDSFEYKASFLLAGEHRSVDVHPTPDMDRDGRPELFAIVRLSESRLFVAIESPADDSFEIVWTSEPAPTNLSGCRLDHGDIDGDDVLELVVSTYPYYRMFRAFGDNDFREVWREDAVSVEIELVDVDGDGRDEMVTEEAGEIIIREYVSLGVAALAQRELQRASPLPAIVRAGAASWLQPLEAGVDVQVLSADGRVLVEDRSRIADVRRLRPGAYFVRLFSGSASVTRKVLVVP